MKKYEIVLSFIALNGIEKLKKSGDKNALRKLKALLDELEDHPFIGTGKPEQLKDNRTAQWSRRINQKHRLVYEVDNDKIKVLVISTYGHYDDK